MFCGNCGTENKESFQFCKSCGANLAVQAGKIVSEVDGLDLKDKDTAEDVHVKLTVQDILDRFPLREGEEVLDVACYFLHSSKEQSKKVKKVILALSVLWGLLPWLFIFLFFVVMLINEDYFYFAVMLGLMSIVLVPICTVKQVKLERLKGEKQILIVTNQRILGRGAGTAKAVAENRTLINLEIRSYYTQEVSKILGLEKFTLEYGNNNREFYGLRDLERVLYKIDEVRSAENYNT